MTEVKLSPDGRTITVFVPIGWRRRGGRKVIVAPQGCDDWAPPPKFDRALVKALARAHRWQRMLENGQYGTLAELADAERISRSYVCRILRLTLLAPDIVERVMDGRPTAGLAQFLKPFPVEWERQREQFLCRGLGHSKEELQSINEELQTVNRRSRSRAAGREHAVIRESVLKGTAGWR